MRTVGLLLVSALMVVPVAAAQNLVPGFYAALGTAMALGVVVAVGGAAGSFYLNAAPGALIVVLAIIVFAISWPVSALLRRRRRAPVELPETPATEGMPTPHVLAGTHPHVHGASDCEHPSVRHGDHVDYVHDGHRHAVHRDHYDEH
jgi:zinc transport system permease protein